MKNQFLSQLYNSLKNQSILRRRASIEALKSMLKEAKSSKEADVLSKAVLIAESFLNPDEKIREKLKEQLID